MNVWAARLSFLSTRRSLASISRESGVPYRILLQVKGGGSMPPGYSANLTPIYRRETYQAMVEAGTPTRIAGSLRGGALENVLNTISSISARVNAWARGATLIHFHRERLMLSNPEVKAYYERMQGQIRSALNGSFETLDRITADPKGIT